MRHKIPGSADLYITDELNFESMDGGTCDLPRPDKDHVTLMLHGAMTTESVLWLYGIAYCGIMDKHKQRDVSFTPILRGRKNAFCLFPIQKNVWLWDQDPTYRISARYPTIAVNEKGVCKNVDTGKRLSTTYTGRDRRRLSVTTSNGRVKVARAVAFAWVPNPWPSMTNEINHKNGDPTQDQASNLEWVTIQENNAHAVDTGLRSDTITCRIRDIHTEAIVEQPSLSEALAYVGVKFDRPTRVVFVRRAVNNPWAGRYEIRIDGDDRPWFYHRGINYRGATAGSRWYHVFDINGERVIYSGVQGIVKDFKLWNMHLYGGSNQEAILKRLLRENPQVILIESVDQFPDRIIQVLDDQTGDVFETSSIKELFRRTGVTSVSIAQSLAHDGVRLYGGRYRFRIKTDVPWPRVEERKTTTRAIKVTDSKTGNHFIGRSLREVSGKFNISRDVLKHRLKTGRGEGALSFSYVDASQLLCENQELISLN